MANVSVDCSLIGVCAVRHGLRFGVSRRVHLFAATLVAVGCLLVSTAPAHATDVGSPGALGANDSADWSQLGSPGSNISNPFSATSTGGIGITGSFSGGGGTVFQVCPTLTCDYGPAAPGFNAGDSLIVTEDSNGNPSGPLTLAFSAPVLGAGLFLQLDALGTFTATLSVVGGSSGSESVISDSSGDPVFLGALDGTADITGLIVGISSCTPSSPGGCSDTDFAVDTLMLTTPSSSAPTPEPPALALVALGLGCLVFWNPLLLTRRRKLAAVTLACAAGLSLVFTTAPVKAQDAIVPPGGAPSADGTVAVRDAHSAASAGALASPAIIPVSPPLPIWNYSVTSPVDGNTYAGYMIGTSPFLRAARSTTIPVVLIPVIVNFHNTTSGFTATFDPTSTPDAGCTGSTTAFSLVENSPIFQSMPWTLNGVSVGNTQYVDAFQRANFWEYVKNTGNAYHVLLNYTVGATMTLNVTYAAPTAVTEVFAQGSAGPCTNPSASGVTNAGLYTGVANINTVDAALQSYITAHGITQNQFPLFIMYNTVMGIPSDPGFYDAGYHASETPYPAALTSPGQTYAIADIQTNQFFSNPGLNSGTSGMSHEVTEWMDDPGVYNLTPAWGHIGQVSGCQNNLEPGDALTGTNLPGIAGPGGFTYYLQELVFYSWFFRIPTSGTGGVFSDNGTFTTDAGSVCM